MQNGKENEVSVQPSSETVINPDVLRANRESEGFFQS